jgi:(p)ppGpp synthase/HD superfamily hydrolase
MSLIPPAIELAFAAHEGQLRDEGTPYVEHPLRVWESFKRHRPLGDTPIRRYEELGCVAILHDVLEDCDVTFAQLEREFSPFVAENVYLLTKRPLMAGEAKAERDAAYFAALRQAPADIQLIKLLDRLDNLSGLSASPRPGKVARYVEETERVFLPWAEAVSARVHREMSLHLEDLKRSLPASN